VADDPDLGHHHHHRLAEDIFGEVDPVGEILQVANVPYLVIGVLHPKLQMGTYKGPDAQGAVIPITTFAAQWSRYSLNNVVFKVGDPEDMPSAREEFARALSARYRFDPTDEQVTRLWDTAEGGKSLAAEMRRFQIFLGVIGALTLLVGGIGVANIMYAVVKEKTREIGVQMAIGAHRSWITGPFVLQGMTYTLLGGALGLVIAIVLIVLLDLVPVEGNRSLEFLGKPTLNVEIAVAGAARFHRDPRGLLPGAAGGRRGSGGDASL